MVHKAITCGKKYFYRGNGMRILNTRLIGLLCILTILISPVALLASAPGKGEVVSKDKGKAVSKGRGKAVSKGKGKAVSKGTVNPDDSCTSGCLRAKCSWVTGIIKPGWFIFDEVNKIPATETEVASCPNGYSEGKIKAVTDIALIYNNKLCNGVSYGCGAVSKPPSGNDPKDSTHSTRTR